MSNGTPPEAATPEQPTKATKPGQPTLIRYYGGGKGKKRRTRGLRTMQTAENRLTKASRTLADALEKGFKIYRDERKKSAQKKRDGAMVDFVDNFAAGVEETQRVAAPASNDVITAFSTKRTRKQLRRAARAISRFFPFVR